MLIIKFIGLFLIFIIAMYIGMIYSKSYTNRVKDLEEMKNALEIFKLKIKFTYKPIPDVFEEISKETRKNIGIIFLKAKNNMENYTAAESWKNAMEYAKLITNFTKEDIEIILNLSKTLGNSDLDGQISVIELTQTLIEKQLKNAREEEQKNGKLYKKMGIAIGLTIIIILV